MWSSKGMPTVYIAERGALLHRRFEAHRKRLATTQNVQALRGSPSDVQQHLEHCGRRLRTTNRSNKAS